MSHCLLGLGSNLGDRGGTIQAALAQLDGTPGVRVTRVSSLHSTHPAGGPEDQPDFLNACAIVETSHEPRALLAVTQRIENELGRLRRERWGPRTLDIDLLLFDKLQLRSDDLEIPHLRFAVRKFALAPAAEIAADWIYPINGWLIPQLLKNLNDSPRFLTIDAWDRTLIQNVIDGLRTHLAGVALDNSQDTGNSLSILARFNDPQESLSALELIAGAQAQERVRDNGVWQFSSAGFDFVSCWMGLVDYGRDCRRLQRDPHWRPLVTRLNLLQSTTARPRFHVVIAPEVPEGSSCEDPCGLPDQVKLINRIADMASLSRSKPVLWLRTTNQAQIIAEIRAACHASE